MYMVLCLVLIAYQDVTGDEYQRRNVPIIGDQDFYLERSTDMLIIGESLFISENQAHRVQKMALGTSLRHLGVVATKGEGPGEVWLPVTLARWRETGFAVKDNRGISFFDETGKYEDRFRVYTPRLGLTTLHGKIYYLTSRVDSEDLIDIYQPDGSLEGSMLPKFLELVGDDDMLAQVESYFYRGTLLSDGDHIYYLNATVGDLFAINSKGEVVNQRNITKDMGLSGMFVKEKVQEYLKDPGMLLSNDGYLAYFLYRDAYLANGKIYVLRWADGEIKSTRKDIVVLDGVSLKMVELIHFRMEPGEFLWSFAVQDDGTARRIFLSMETNQDADYQIVELVR